MSNLKILFLAKLYWLLEERPNFGSRLQTFDFVYWEIRRKVNHALDSISYIIY